MLDAITTTQPLMCKLVTLAHTLVSVLFFAVGVTIGTYLTRKHAPDPADEGDRSQSGN